MILRYDFFTLLKLSIKYKISTGRLTFQIPHFTSLTNELEKLKQKIPNTLASEFNRKTFLDDLLKTWFAAFHTTPEAMKLSKDEIEILDNYLYANILIIECKNAAVGVSQKTWQEIESEMLLPRP